MTFQIKIYEERAFEKKKNANDGREKKQTCGREGERHNARDNLNLFSVNW